MADTTDSITTLTDDALGRLIADTALQLAQAQVLLDRALDELYRRIEQPRPPVDRN